jgi:hypothetical protein
MGSQGQSRLRRLWERWKVIARRIGDFQARAMLVVFYFVIVGPLALVLRWRSDPLAIKPGSRRGWIVRDDAPGMPMQHARRQFS